MREMPSLFVKCRQCHEEFPSGIALADEAGLSGVTMNGLHHTCPKCGAVGEFFTADYFVPKGIEKVVGQPPDKMTPAVAAGREETVRLAGYGVGK
ncbi:MAG: hypothetical protein L3K18_08910 [Thermoplasmata archaeon]|nr:hypothetical protein [Thermoplasmata archaeon]